MVDSVEVVRAGYELLEGAGGAAVGERDVIEVTGPDAGRYLQGQLSQDVVVLGEGSSTWSLLLQPTGKVDAWVRVHRRSEEDYAIDVDAGWGEATAARLRRFLLRTKAEVAAPVRRPVLAVRHGAAFISIGAGGRLAEDPGWLSGVVAGPGVVGVDRIGPADSDVREAAAEEELEVVDLAALERHRVAHLVPAMGAELTEGTIPAEAGQWLIDASVSFTKGCYTGQELVARIDSRGNTVPRPVRLLRVDDPEPAGWAPGVDAPVVHEGREVGRTTSAVSSLGEGLPALALAIVARSVPAGATVELEGSDGPVTAVVHDQPSR